MVDECDRYWMKEPCGPCPFSRSKTLPLHPERAADFAYMAQNPYTDFVCHKTADCVEDADGMGEYVRGQQSFTCNGFLSLQVNEGATPDEGFEPHPDAFSDADEMIEHHEMLWEQGR
jgi:hypothetical protein